MILMLSIYFHIDDVLCKLVGHSKDIPVIFGEVLSITILCFLDVFLMYIVTST
jgi:hypothetical protein